METREEEWKTCVEEDLVGDAAGDTLLEKDTPWQRRDTPDRTVGCRQPVLELGNPQTETVAYGRTHAEARTPLKGTAAHAGPMLQQMIHSQRDCRPWRTPTMGRTPLKGLQHVKKLRFAPEGTAACGRDHRNPQRSRKMTHGGKLK